MNKDILKEVYAEIFEKTKKEYISLKPFKERCSVFDSKLGGIPYKLEDSYLKNEKLYFLGQLNLEELPKLKGFPHEGMLQFFISEDENKMWGAADYKEYRVIYHNSINYSLKEEKYTIKYKDNFPVKGEYRLKGEINYSPMTVNDYRFNKVFMEIYKKYINSNAEGYWEIENIDEDEINIIFSANDIRYGGNPAFIQGDIREYSEKYRNSILLFQVPSILEKDIHISWGDAGIANFFINEEDLMKKNFKKVIFSWDCY